MSKVPELSFDTPPKPLDEVRASAMALITNSSFLDVMRHLKWQCSVDIADCEPHETEKRESLYYQSYALNWVAWGLQALASEGRVAHQRDEQRHRRTSGSP